MNTEMLLIPINKAKIEISDNRGFKSTSQAMAKKITASNKKGNPRPRNEMNHHFCGFRYGTRHDNKKINTTSTLLYIKNLLVKMRNLLAISAIYKKAVSKE